MKYKDIKKIAADLKKKGDLNEEHWKILQKKYRTELLFFQTVMVVNIILFYIFTSLNFLTSFFGGIFIIVIHWVYVYRKVKRLCSLHVFGIKTEAEIININSEFFPSTIARFIRRKNNRISIDFSIRNGTRHHLKYKYHDQQGNEHLKKRNFLWKEQMFDPIPKVGGKMIVFYNKDDSEDVEIYLPCNKCLLLSTKRSKLL